ncbi:MAG: ATP-binding protein [Acidobacteriota bacterium]
MKSLRMHREHVESTPAERSDEDSWGQFADLPARDLQWIIEQSPTQLAVFDANLRYLYVNTAAVGDPSLRRWLIGKTDFEYCRLRGLDSALAERRMDFILRAIEERRTISFDEEFTDAKGRPLHFIRMCTPIFDQKGELQRLIGFGVDTTETKRLEDELQQAQKLEALGKLVAGVAHDFNNLLTAINGFAQVLSSRLPEPSTERRQAKEILKAGRQAADLTRQLLAFSRSNIRETRDVDLGALVTDQRAILEQILGKGITLLVELSDDELIVRGDPVHLRQILTNLALNARDAMPEGGRLEISVRVADGEPLGAAKGAIELRVRDTGHGMDLETLEHALEPFFTTKTRDRGTGLGLSSVYGIVQQCRGELDIQSTLGEGTDVRIMLPRRMSPRAASDDSSFDSTPRGRGETILVTEDEPAVLELASCCLRHLGYRVLTASNAAEAEAVASREPIDLLLTDIVMPGVGGPELAQRLLERQPTLAVLFMTGYAQREALQHIGRAVSVVHKPFTTECLGRQVRRVLDTHDAASRPAISTVA